MYVCIMNEQGIQNKEKKQQRKGKKKQTNKVRIRPPVLVYGFGRRFHFDLYFLTVDVVTFERCLKYVR